MESDSTDVTPSKLLDLPPEIRNQIFFLAVANNDERPLTFTKSVGFRTHAYPGPPNITRTCRQVRQETLPIFYGANTFVFDSARLDPLKWHDDVLNDVRDATKLIKTIVLKSEFADNVRGPHPLAHVHQVELKLSLNPASKVKVDYLGSLSNVCTCRLEEAAANVSSAHCYNPVFLFATALHHLTYLWRVRPYDKPALRTKQCKCGERKKSSWA